MQTTTSSLQDSQEGGFSATHHHHHHHPLSPPPTTTRTTTTKRPFSPSSASPSPKKSLKKSPSTTTTNTITQGFSRITLPITFPSPSSPLHRTLSEPISSFNPTNAPFSPFSATSHNSSSSAHFLNSQFQEPGKNKASPSPPASSNSLHKLLRSISDPTTLSFGHQSGDTSSSKRLEKMKGIVKGISQLCDEVIYEDENENENENENEDVVNKECSDSENHDHAGDDQEAVSVEKKGDCLVLHFNCPCGLGYEILLSGKECYYRLT